MICAHCRRPLKNVLSAQISEVRREVARMGLRAEDE